MGVHGPAGAAPVAGKRQDHDLPAIVAQSKALAVDVLTLDLRSGPSHGELDGAGTALLRPLRRACRSCPRCRHTARPRGRKTAPPPCSGHPGLRRTVDRLSTAGPASSSSFMSGSGSGPRSLRRSPARLTRRYPRLRHARPRASGVGPSSAAARRSRSAAVDRAGRPSQLAVERDQLVALMWSRIRISAACSASGGVNRFATSPPRASIATGSPGYLRASARNRLA